jgi:N-dimethylarginine dimethylaminohydrolase
VQREKKEGTGKKKKKSSVSFFFPRLSLKLLGFHRPVRSRNQNNSIKSKGSSRLPYAHQEEWEVLVDFRASVGIDISLLPDEPVLAQVVYTH